MFALVLVCGLGYVAYALARDLTTAVAVPWILLGLALLIALGFEFVNGFHDTANAVATVIYTRSMPAEFAVIWSGFFNFLGVLTSSGAVAFGILALLPVELILQVGSGSGLAMVFALLIAAIVWNLGTGISACRRRALTRWSARSSASASPTSSWHRQALRQAASTGRRRPILACRF